VDQGEAPVLADRRPLGVPSGRDVEAGHGAAGDGPFQEGARGIRVGRSGVPGIDIGLRRVLEAAAAAGQPDEVLPRLAELVRCRN
jgi:hypothetical protein